MPLLNAGLCGDQGIGLPLEEAMKFWRSEFGPKCAGEVLLLLLFAHACMHACKLPLSVRMHGRHRMQDT
jgi:hypothetical protein